MQFVDNIVSTPFDFFLTYPVVDGDVKHPVVQTQVYLPPGVVVSFGRMDTAAPIVLHWLVSSSCLAVHSQAARACGFTVRATEPAADVSSFPICYIYCTEQKTKQMEKLDIFCDSFCLLI